jgi:hypothetical protein
MPRRVYAKVETQTSSLQRARSLWRSVGAWRKRIAPVESKRMIRDKRTWIAVNAVGAAAALFMLITQSVFPSPHPFVPRWFLLANTVLLFGLFIYNIVRRLRGPIEPARWARNMSDGQLWIIKGILMLIIISVALDALALRFPRP